jgi:hypothetical protein
VSVDVPARASYVQPLRGQKVSRRRSQRLRNDAYASLLSELASELGQFGMTDQDADSTFRRISEAD